MVYTLQWCIHYNCGMDVYTAAYLTTVGSQVHQSRPDYEYSKTSLYRLFTVVNSAGPFREVVDLDNFP